MNSLQLPSLNDVDQVPMVVEKNIVATTSSPKKRARDDADELDVGIFAKAPKFTTTVNDVLASKAKVEKDPARLAARLKQIAFGKNTVGYDNYIDAVPKNKRRGYKEHPRTPDIYEVMSKRCFDGKVKAWRRAIHEWDAQDTGVSAASSQGIRGNVDAKDDLFENAIAHETVNATASIESETNSQFKPILDVVTPVTVEDTSAIDPVVDYEEEEDVL